MVTHGGGWTLVYSYTFTDYNDFGSSSNAVTPRPNWPASGGDVPISTTPPLNESSFGAVDWNFWTNIGEELMVKSNINHWVVCEQISGSFLTKKVGSANCQNIKNVASKCTGEAPNKIGWTSIGPGLMDSAGFYFFEGNTGSDYPTHDPCGTGSDLNHKKAVDNPGGKIYLR